MEALVSLLSSLPQSSRVHITRAVLEQFLSFAKYLDGLPHGAPLLKQLCDHVLFNAAIWIHTPAKVRSHPAREKQSEEFSGIFLRKMQKKKELEEVREELKGRSCKRKRTEHASERKHREKVTIEERTSGQERDL